MRYSSKFALTGKLPVVYWLVNGKLPATNIIGNLRTLEVQNIATSVLVCMSVARA